MRSAVAAAGRGALELVLGLDELRANFLSEALHAITSVEGGADLLVSLNEASQLCVQVSILAFKHVNMRLEGFNFAGHVAVALAHALVAETDIVKLLAGGGQLVLAGPDFLVKLVEVRSEVSVLEALLVSLALLAHFLFNLTVKLTLQLGLLSLLASVIILGACLFT